MLSLRSTRRSLSFSVGGARCTAASSLTPEEFDARFDAALGFDHGQQELDPETRSVLDAIRRERPPWEAEIPLAEPAAADALRRLLPRGR